MSLSMSNCRPVCISFTQISMFGKRGVGVCRVDGWGVVGVGMVFLVVQ
jgi:hypothetical protein